MGRRERKKAQTRDLLAQTALQMFLDRGYDQVGVREVADAADVSVSTLFKYFPSKEALVFDLADDLEAQVVAAVLDRPAGQSVTRALHDHVLSRVQAMASVPHYPAFAAMVDRTPALQDYAHRMWSRHQRVIARVIADQLGAPADDPGCAALAFFALGTIEWAPKQRDPVEAVKVGFSLIEHGWAASRRTADNVDGREHRIPADPAR
jgi:AcrR family transcriptional regulator